MPDVSREEEVVLRGRPRPEETIRRDEHVLRILQSGSISRNRILERLSKECFSLEGILRLEHLFIGGECKYCFIKQGYRISPSQVWLSLDRLRKEGRVKLCQGIGERVWTSAVDKPCP